MTHNSLTNTDAPSTADPQHAAPVGTNGSPRANATKVSLLAFGDPLDGRTFSGISRAVGRALEEGNRLKNVHRIRDLRPWDALRGAVQMRWADGRPRFSVRREWLWRRSGGNHLLEDRLHRRLQKTSDAGPFLQIGSLVRIPERLGLHYVFTDMTVPQAAEHRQFAIGRADPAAIKEATRIQAEVFANAQHIFVAADWTRRSVIKDFSIAPELVTTVYVGSNLVESGQRRRTVAERRRQIMFIGIDWERKGGPLMIDAFRILRKRVPDAELAIVGCSPQIDAPGVNIVGYLSPHKPENRRRIAELMDESRCLCLLSHFDPMPNAIIEAYSFGLPVVALDTGSRAEVVEHGASGLLCQDERPETVADAMEQLLTDDALVERAGERARQLHVERFNWQAVVGRMCRVIDQA